LLAGLKTVNKREAPAQSLCSLDRLDGTGSSAFARCPLVSYVAALSVGVMAYWHDPPATSAPLRLLLCLLIVGLRVTSALQSVPGSPCEAVCSDAGTLEDDVVCLDASYQSLASGRGFQKCVACQLNSTAVDTASNETDVEFGLCMYNSAKQIQKKSLTKASSSGPTLHTRRMHVCYSRTSHLHQQPLSSQLCPVERFSWIPDHKRFFGNRSTG
jgi:hypothetical protein